MTMKGGIDTRPSFWHQIPAHGVKELKIIALLALGLFVGYSLNTHHDDDRSTALKWRLVTPQLELAIGGAGSPQADPAAAAAAAAASPAAVHAVASEAGSQGIQQAAAPEQREEAPGAHTPQQVPHHVVVIPQQQQHVNTEGSSSGAAGEPPAVSQSASESTSEGESRTEGGDPNSILAQPLAPDTAIAPGLEANVTGSNSTAPGSSTPESVKTALQLALLPGDEVGVTDETMLDRGIIYAGAGARTRGLLRKLAAGKEVSVVVLGGSIAMGHATRGWPQSACGAFGAIVKRWIGKAFPAASVLYHNGAVGGTPSGYMSMCLNWHCPQNADIVLVEYAVNDGNGHDLSLRRPFERLLRKLLAMPNRPEVLLVMTYANTADFERASAEDDMATFALYYGLPWVSLRELLFHASRGDAPKVALDQIFEDDHHPVELGHQMIADMVIGHFRRAAAGMLLRNYLEASDAAAAAEVLPPPLLKGNEVMKAEHCIFHDEFRAIVKQADGFQWTNEAAEGEPPKVGYVAVNPGSQLRLALNTSDVMASPEAQGSADWHAIVAINYLGSYEHMGTAAVTCEAGCSCEPSVLDGHIEPHNSQHFMHRFGVTQAENCEIVVTVAEETKSAEHKVKIMGVVLLDDPTQKDREIPQFHPDTNIGMKGATGDLRFESSWKSLSFLRAQKEVSYNGTELEPPPGLV